MAQTNRTPAQQRIARSQAIRRDRRQRAERQTQPAAAAKTAMPAELLADCIAAGGFDQNASYAI